jgi:hypothetical protein
MTVLSTRFASHVNELDTAGYGAELVLVRGTPLFRRPVGLLPRIWQSIFQNVSFDTKKASSALMIEAKEFMKEWESCAFLSHKQLRQIKPILKVFSVTQQMFPNSAPVQNEIDHLREALLQRLSRESSPKSVELLIKLQYPEKAWQQVLQKPSIIHLIEKKSLEKLRPFIYQGQFEEGAIALFENGLVDDNQALLFAKALLRKKSWSTFDELAQGKLKPYPAVEDAIRTLVTAPLQSLDASVRSRLRRFSIEVPSDYSTNNIAAFFKQLESLHSYLDHTKASAPCDFSEKATLFSLLKDAETTNFLAFSHFFYRKYSKETLEAEETAIREWLKTPAARSVTCLQGRGQFWYIPDEIEYLTGLQEIELSLCHIRSVSPKIWTLQNLKTVNLSLNELDELPEPSGKLPNLEVLTVGANQLKSLPPLHNLPSLKTLNAVSNQIESWPEGIEQLKKLEDCQLWCNRLTSLPPALGTLPCLKILRVEENAIEQLFLQGFHALSILNVYGNKLTHVSLAPHSLENLQKLYVQGNKLSSIQGIEGCGNLLELDLRDNLFVEPPDTRCSFRLHTLKLNRNPLKKIPEELFQNRTTTVFLSGFQRPLIPKDFESRVRVEWNELS